MPNVLRNAVSSDLLSPRQTEIAQMIARGTSSRGIADTLGLSPRTVEAHVVAIFNKLGVRSRVELTASLLGPNETGTKPAATSLPNTNLPLQRTSLIGREPDIANIVKLLEGCRLVTVTGAAGVGKTRTALAVGDAILDGSTDGVWFVELAELIGGSTAELAVALALNIHESPNCPLLETLLRHLKQKSLLLVLDNCENVIVEARALADAIIGACPHVRIVATSRELLRVPGEQTYKLPTLRVPLAHETQRITAVEAGRYPSVSLFAKRAQAINHAFALSDENAPVTAEICLRLDGVPLAIELAAAQVNSLSVQALLSRLDQQLRILQSRNQSALPRHQSISALMDSSYDLLTPPTQRLFEKLSIFAGGCTLSAAASACSNDGSDELSVLTSLSSLIDKSLVTADLSKAEPRYRLLETCRHYAYDKLVARREAATMARRHAVTYVELAECMEREHDVNPDSAWFARAVLELENYRAALDWTLRRRGDVELGQRLAGSLRPIWTYFSLAEGRRWVCEARELSDGATPTTVSANLDFAAACFAYLLGEHEAALRANRKLALDYRELGEAPRAVRANIMAGMMLVVLGKFGEGEALLRATLEEAYSLENRRLIGLGLEGVGNACSAQGNVDGAREHFDKALALYDAMGADRYLAAAACTLAEAEFRAGNSDRAVTLATASLATQRSAGDGISVARVLNNLAAYHIACDRWVAAHERAYEALELARETQHEYFFATALQHVAAVAALSTPQSSNAVEQAMLAARLLGYADSRIAVLGSTRGYTEGREYERLFAALRRTLGADDTARSMTIGAAMTPDRAVEISGKPLRRRSSGAASRNRAMRL